MLQPPGRGEVLAHERGLYPRAQLHMTFQPPHCPNPACTAYSARPFLYRRKGSYRRRCDGRTVTRFVCLACQRSFSSQTFRLDYRLHRPELSTRLFRLLTSKVTLRQSARVAGCNRKTVEHRLRLLGGHCQAYQERELGQAQAKGGLRGVFQLDELETFEQDRRLAPVSVPVLIERDSFFVLHATTAPLPARGNLRPADQRRKAQRQAREGVRKSGSAQAVQGCWDVLAKLAAPQAPVEVATDSKRQYRRQLERTFGARLLHYRAHSSEPRVPGSLLFAINHTLAQMRDGLSRLVRRNWGASKKRERLELHQWLWMGWRNWVRGMTNKRRKLTPAMALGVAAAQLPVAELLRLRVFPGAFRPTQ